MATLLEGMENSVLIFMIIFVIGVIYVIYSLLKVCYRRYGSRPVVNARGVRIPSETYNLYLIFRCAICAERIEFEVESNCGHVYCAKCFVEFWRSRNNEQLDCPYCRRPISLFFEYISYLIYQKLCQ